MELWELPLEIVQHYERNMLWELRRFAAEPDFQELTSQARTAVWIALSTLPPESRSRATAFVRFVTRRAVSRYYSRWKPKSSGHRPLEVLEEREMKEERIRGDRWMRWTTPDFAPAVIDKVAGEQLAQAVRKTLSAAEWETVRDFFLREGLGIPDAVRARVTRLLNRYRKQLGMPLKNNGGLAGAGRPPRKSPEERRARERERDKERYRRNREKKVAQKKAYYHRNREKVLQRSKDRYWSEKEGKNRP